MAGVESTPQHGQSHACKGNCRPWACPACCLSSTAQLAAALGASVPGGGPLPPLPPAPTHSPAHPPHHHTPHTRVDAAPTPPASLPWQVFVANPNKTRAVVEILYNNKEKLLKYLDDFHNDRGGWRRRSAGTGAASGPRLFRQQVLSRVPGHPVPCCRRRTVQGGEGRDHQGDQPAAAAAPGGAVALVGCCQRLPHAAVAACSQLTRCPGTDGARCPTLGVCGRAGRAWHISMPGTAGSCASHRLMRARTHSAARVAAA